MTGDGRVIVVNAGNNLEIFNQLKQILPGEFTMEDPDYSDPIKSGPDHNVTFSTTCTIHIAHKNGIKGVFRQLGKGSTKKAATNDCHGAVNKQIMKFVAKHSAAKIQVSNPNAVSKRKKEENSTKSSNAKSPDKKVTKTKTYFTKPKNGGYLGKGSFGKVFCVVKKGKERELLALKVPRYEECDEDGIDDDEEIENFNKELTLHQEAQGNDFVAKIFGVAYLQNRRAFVMEYCSRGTLEDLTKDEPNVAPSLIFRIHKEIADALNYLHKDKTYETRIAHNDLKPSNVLLTEDFHARLTDFGGSTKTTQTTQRTDPSATVEVKLFTNYFLSPERASKEKGLSEKLSDIYSFGVCLYASLCTPDYREPFRIQYKNYERATTAEIRKRLHILEIGNDDGIADADILYEMFKMVRHCCRGKPKCRPTAEEVYYEAKSYYEYNNVRKKALKAQDILKKKRPSKNNFTYDKSWVDVEELKL